MTAKREPVEEPETNGQEGLAAGPEGDEPMSFWDHVGELRSRLIRAALAVIVGCVACFTFVTQLREFLAAPLHTGWAEAKQAGTPKLQALGMMDVFITDMRVAITFGLFLSLPVLFYQFWKFVSPGLYKHEKRFVVPFVFTSSLMFLLGAAFCYFYVLPWTIQWLLGYGTSSAGTTTIEYQLTINTYIRDSTKMLVAFGMVFEFPLLVAFLAFAGVVTHLTLLRFWKISVVLIFIIAAFLTPPEPVSQLMMAIPMVALFFASVGVAYMITKSRRGEETQALDVTSRDGD
ncbi:MAG: twin-arginine translocase subunit TatC [Nannocystaceae bacterium]|nr:twin-arginine translocase subunit TatC [Myxococcales bacterium]